MLKRFPWAVLSFVAAALLVCIWQAYKLHDSVDEAKKIVRAQRQLREIATTAIDYMQKDPQAKSSSMYHSFPVSMDPWSLAYTMEVQPDLVRVRSAGPDTIWNTDDDLSYDLKFPEKSDASNQPSASAL